MSTVAMRPKKTRARTRVRVRNALVVLVIVLVVMIDLYPLYFMYSASFKTNNEFVTNPAYAFNQSLHWQNYVDSWTRGNMGVFFTNSLFNTAVSLVFITLFALTISFALIKMEWKGRKFFTQYFAFGIMVPVATTLIPLFVIYNTGGLYNTRLGLILVYIASAISFSVYLLSGYMRALPDEILEASVIDGCNIYAMMWHIVMPLMKNALITVVVIQFFFKWNDLLYSMTLISSSSLKTMQTGLLYFSDEFGSKNWGAIFASVSISVTPMLLMYLLLNKMVIEGMTAGAIKG
jgi:raffinose/stachyose/melibiose transport system permease protein